MRKDRIAIITKKNALQQSGSVEGHHSSSSNSNGGIGVGLLVWNYETTGQPIENQIDAIGEQRRRIGLEAILFHRHGGV